MNNTTTTKPSVTVQAVPFNTQTQQFGTVTPQVQVVPPITPAVIPQSQNISTFGTQAINIPPVNVTQPTVSTVNEAENFIQRTSSPETEAQRKEKSLADIIYKIAPNLQGQTAYEDFEAKRLGRDEKLIQLNTLNNELRIKDAELRQDDIKLAQDIQNIEDKPIAMEFITGQQQSVARNAQIMKALKLSERDMMNARAIGLQGDIALAESMAKKAVETKYAPWKELLETVRLQQEALKPQLDADEKKQLREQEIKTKLAFNDIERREENEDTANKMIINAMPFAPQSVTSAAQKVISQGGSVVQVAQALGKYAGDFLGNQLKLSSIRENEMQIAKIANDIKQSQATIPNNAPVGSTNYSITSWANSAKNKNSLTSEERSGISKAFSVVNQIGALQQNLKKDQTSFFGGNVKKVMASLGQNADAGTIQAQITALVPQVAKGIYGEVGVLTDQDTTRYTQTLPNLTSPEQQNDAVTALTLTALRNGVKSKLDVAAASNLDVSGFVPLYQDLTTKINAINDRTGVNDVRVGEIVKANPQAKPLVEAMIKEGKKGSEILQVLGAD